MEWAPFLREFGLPIGMLFLFAGAIGTGLLVAGKSVKDERAQWSNERTQWSNRVDDWKDRALKAELRLESAVPALKDATEELRATREVLREVAMGRAGQ